MLGGSKVTSDHVPSFHLDDKDIHPSGNDPTTKDWVGSSETEPSAHLLEEEMEGEEDGEGEVDKEEEI